MQMKILLVYNLTFSYPRNTTWRKNKNYFDTADVSWTKKYWSIAQSLTQAAPGFNTRALNYAIQHLALGLCPSGSRH